MRIQVKVVPRAKKREVRQLADGTWRVAVAAPAEGGRANSELIEALAKHFDVPKGSLWIVRGQTSRLKQIEIPRSCY